MKYKNISRLIEQRRFILASRSPRRVQLLTEAGLPFHQIVADIEESNSLNLFPYDLAVWLACQKASAIIDKTDYSDIILGCDTIVVLDGKVLGKPTDKNNAIEILSLLSGQKHTVCSAVALRSEKEIISGFELTDVYFKNTHKNDIISYVETGEPMDKAGAYGIQDRGVFLVDRVSGNIDNVIGMPMTLLERCAGELALKLELL